MKLLEDNIKAIIKPQYVDHIPRVAKGTVAATMNRRDERKCKEQMCTDLGPLLRLVSFLCVCRRVLFDWELFRVAHPSAF